MDKKVIKFDDVEIEKWKFYQHKKAISIDNIDINIIVVQNQVFLVKRILNILLAIKILKK